VPHFGISKIKTFDPACGTVGEWIGQLGGLAWDGIERSCFISDYLSYSPSEVHLVATQIAQHAMSRQLDNVNPTIFAPTHASSSRQKSGKALLWDEHAEGYAEVDTDGGLGPEGSEGETDEREEIDSEEVFGASGCASAGFTGVAAPLIPDRPTPLHHRSGTSRLARAAPRGQSRGHTRLG
jgi:hypothetical protein